MKWLVIGILGFFILLIVGIYIEEADQRYCTENKGKWSWQSHNSYSGHYYCDWSGK